MGGGKSDHDEETDGEMVVYFNNTGPCEWMGWCTNWQGRMGRGSNRGEEVTGESAHDE